jgi:hypothetical protein
MHASVCEHARSAAACTPHAFLAGFPRIRTNAQSRPAHSMCRTSSQCRICANSLRIWAYVAWLFFFPNGFCWEKSIGIHTVGFQGLHIHGKEMHAWFKHAGPLCTEDEASAAVTCGFFLRMELHNAVLHVAGTFFFQTCCWLWIIAAPNAGKSSVSTC